MTQKTYKWQECAHQKQKTKREKKIIKANVILVQKTQTEKEKILLSGNTTKMDKGLAR